MGREGGRGETCRADPNHLIVPEDEQKDEQVVDGEAVLHHVRREEVEGRRAPVQEPHSCVEGERRREEQPERLYAVVVHSLDRARRSQRALEPAHIDGAASFGVDHREDGLLIWLGGLHLQLVHKASEARKVDLVREIAALEHILDLALLAQQGDADCADVFSSYLRYRRCLHTR